MSTVVRGLSPKNAADYLGISEQTLRKQRCAPNLARRMPMVPFARAGRRVVYLKEELDAWLEARRADGVGSIA